MSLLDEFSEKFKMMDQVKTSDGEGGFVTKWTESDVEFLMPQAHDTTVEAQTAEREGTASTYTFYPKKGMDIKYHDVFKRMSDGQYFRCTSPSGEKKTPASSGLDLTMITAEKWEMTT